MKTAQEIRALYDRFDQHLNIDTSHMAIKFTAKRGNMVACCCMERRADKYVPTEFHFNLQHMEWMPEAEWDDIIRHEYAHAAAVLLTGRAEGHSPFWKQLCIKLGCRPSPYTYNLSLLEPLHNYQSEVDEGIATKPIECTRCGNITYQPTDSRIVKLITSGIKVWNYHCKKCGGVVFRLAAPEAIAQTTAKHIHNEHINATCH